MPSFKWLAERTVDTRATTKKLALMQRIGVPYSNADLDGAEADLHRQADTIVTDLAAQGIETRWNSEIVAMIAYLQRLGRGPQTPKEGAHVPVAVRQ